MRQYRIKNKKDKKMIPIPICAQIIVAVVTVVIGKEVLTDKK